jgi:hypothetical protein
MAMKGSTATDFWVTAGASAVVASAVGAASSSSPEKKRSHANQASATSNTAMIVRSILSPDRVTVDWLRSTSSSRLMPSGVSSKAQARNNTSGSPSSEFGNLRQHPAEHDVGGAHADDVPSFQFREK